MSDVYIGRTPDETVKNGKAQSSGKVTVPTENISYFFSDKVAA